MMNEPAAEMAGLLQGLQPWNMSESSGIAVGFPGYLEPWLADAIWLSSQYSVC